MILERIPSAMPPHVGPALSPSSALSLRPSTVKEAHRKTLAIGSYNHDDGLSDIDNDSSMIASSPTCFGRYRLLQQLQIGATAEVYAAQDIYSGDMIALKCFTLDDPEDAFRLASHESTVHQLMNGHENIVRLHGMAILSPSKIAIACEYLAGGDLFSLSRRKCLDLPVFIPFATQISSAVLHMHSQDYAHCDIKPENILVSACRTIVKLSDFGSSGNTFETSCRRTFGTTAFQSPELIDDCHIENCLPCDVWACGMTFFHMLSGQLPWDCAHPDDEDFYYHIHGERSPAMSHLWAYLPADVCCLIDHMLCIDISQRWTMAQVCNELSRIAASPTSSLNRDTY